MVPNVEEEVRDFQPDLMASGQARGGGGECRVVKVDKGVEEEGKSSTPRSR